MNVFDKVPSVDKTAFVAPSASLVGDVQVGPGSSIWYGCVLRGDVNTVVVGSGTNIQENSIVHVAKTSLSGKILPTIIGDNVMIGQNAILHGCTVEDEAFIGTGATLLDGVVVEKKGMVASGSLVAENTKIPSGEVWAGAPAKFVRKTNEEDNAFFSQTSSDNTSLAQAHSVENEKKLDEIEFGKAFPQKIIETSLSPR